MSFPDYGGVRLDGRNVAALGSFRGNIREGQAKARQTRFGFNWSRGGHSNKPVGFDWLGPDA